MYLPSSSSSSSSRDKSIQPLCWRNPSSSATIVHRTASSSSYRSSKKHLEWSLHTYTEMLPLDYPHHKKDTISTILGWYPSSVGLFEELAAEFPTPMINGRVILPSFLASAVSCFPHLSTSLSSFFFLHR